MADARTRPSRPTSPAYLRAAEPATSPAAQIRSRATDCADSPALVRTHEGESGRQNPPTPLELLRQLDYWMDHSGMAADHPWRVAIGSTLDAIDQDADPAALFKELAVLADGVSEILLDVVNGETNKADPAYRLICQMGWLADTAAVAHGGAVCRGDFEDWFLSSAGQVALTAARRAGAAKGGAV